MDRFRNLKPPKLNQEDINNLKRPKTQKEIEAAV
jgi:hypothetical protein